MKEIGSWSVRQELLLIPAQIKRLDHVQHAYKCKHCSLINESDKIVKAPVPKAPLAHSYGSASIVAHTLYQKYELKVPAYRQENDWQKIGGCQWRAKILLTGRLNPQNTTLSRFINCLKKSC